MIAGIWPSEASQREFMKNDLRVSARRHLARMAAVTTPRPMCPGRQDRQEIAEARPMVQGSRSVHRSGGTAWPPTLGLAEVEVA